LKAPKASFVIPCHNGQAFLAETLQSCLDQTQPRFEVIVVDDGSMDGTREILKMISGRYKIIFQDKNQGKGAAIKRGFQEATGDIVLIQDADLEYNPREYSDLIRPIIKGRADVVYGSRFLEPGRNNTIVYKHGYLFSRMLNWVSNVLSGVWLSDMYTCYKVFSKDAISKIYPRLMSKRFGIDPELTAWVAKFNFRIMEVPISYKGRTYEEGKKINWKDGLAAIYHIIKFNLFTRK